MTLRARSVKRSYMLFLLIPPSRFVSRCGRKPGDELRGVVLSAPPLWIIEQSVCQAPKGLGKCSKSYNHTSQKPRQGSKAQAIAGKRPSARQNRCWRRSAFGFWFVYGGPPCPPGLPIWQKRIPSHVASARILCLPPNSSLPMDFRQGVRDAGILPPAPILRRSPVNLRMPHVPSGSLPPAPIARRVLLLVNLRST